MDVILDTNVIVADIWQASQNFRFLMNYIEKTNSSILIPTVVDIEVKAFFTRKVTEIILEIQTAHKHAERFQIKQIPPLDLDTIKSTTLGAWDDIYEKEFKQVYGQVIPLRQSILEQAVTRAAYRLPPCKENGEGMRDALIWFQILEYCKTKSSNEPVAFISMNTRDFAGQDKTMLRAELEKDAQGINLLYYPSLEIFLKNYSKSISHITNEWLAARIDFRQVKRKITGYFVLGWQGRLLRDKFKI